MCDLVHLFASHDQTRLGHCRCHLGTSIVYDTVSNLSWAVDIRMHGIVSVIENILSKPWQASSEVGLEVPSAKREDECVVRVRVCSSWTLLICGVP